MKIIYKGEKPKNWWDGYTVTCDNCSSVVQLETKDEPTYQSEYGTIFACIICLASIIIQKKNETT